MVYNKSLPALVVSVALFLRGVSSAQCIFPFAYNQEENLCTHLYPPEGDCATLNPSAQEVTIGNFILCWLPALPGSGGGMGGGGMPPG